MNTVPVTFSLPTHVHKRLIRHVPPRQRSRFVSRALEANLPLNINSQKAWREFFALARTIKWTIDPKTPMSKIKKIYRRGLA